MFLFSEEILARSQGTLLILVHIFQKLAMFRLQEAPKNGVFFPYFFGSVKNLVENFGVNCTTDS